MLQQMIEAIALDRFGDPDVLSIHSLTVPTLDDHEVLIEVDTAGIGSWDTEVRDGALADGQYEFFTRARRRCFRRCRRGTHKLPFDKAPETYKHFDARDKGCTRVVIEPAAIAA
jgi:hypothetical protein